MSVNSHSFEAEEYSKTVFGFWVYLITDFILFSVILASYFVLRNSTHGGIGAKDLAPLSFTFLQTLLILGCSLTAGLAEVMAFRKNRSGVLGFLGATFVLGILFLQMEYLGLSDLVAQGNDWTRSAFLSAYFTLMGTHALHVVFALLWVVVFFPLVFRFGLVPKSLQRFSCLRLFWQFIGLIWVGIFTIVYLLGID